MTSAFDQLLESLVPIGPRRAIAEGEQAHTYAGLLTAVDDSCALLDRHDITPGQVIALQGDFSFRAIALLLALFRRRCVVALLSPGAGELEQRLDDACASGLFFCTGGEPLFSPRSAPPAHPLLAELVSEGDAGFIIFSSGSSGRPKAILHGLEQFLAGYGRARKPMATLAFLLFDHIAGLDTLFYTLHAGGSLVLTGDRGPQAVCRLIERWRVEVLPVSPSFLKLLCLSAAAEGLDLSSLRIITYGSEPMDPATLARVAALFPGVTLRQKYGASEFGAPAARTREDAPAGQEGLWIRLDSEQVGVKVEEGILWLRAPTTMRGYLNAEAPPLVDGWYCTGDRVEVDGPWLRILGRESDLINVGGEKVFPSEVEAVIKELDWVAEVAVTGEAHPMLGQVVRALVRPAPGAADASELRALVRRHCSARLARHKVPMKIVITDEALTSERQKTLRRGL